MRKLTVKQGALCVICLVLLSIQASPQDANVLNKINIASPNASALGKYLDIPVSYHTGVPNINIPIYTVKDGSLSLPISLSYHAGGIKVDELASWVGTGWSLNASGVITRTVKGKPDERQTNSQFQTYGHYSDYGLASIYGLDGGTMSESKFDSEPDLFFFNFGSYSGKFYFNDDRTPMLLPEQDLKIECYYHDVLGETWNNSPGMWNHTFGRCIESFTITTPDGAKYFFGIPNSNQQTTNDPIEVCSEFTTNDGVPFSQVISSWYLYKIQSSDGHFSINLSYERDRYAYYTFVNPIHPHLGETTIIYPYMLVKNYVAGVRLSKITSSNAVVDLIPGEVRQDLSKWVWGDAAQITDYTPDLSANSQCSRALGSVQISDPLGTCFKKFNFSYSYFDDQSTTVISNFNGMVTDKKRLKLLSFQETSCNGGLSIPPYTFEYYHSGVQVVPRRFSFAKDHWGYNNGAAGNTNLYPPLTAGTANINTGYPTPAIRESSSIPMKEGTLNKINYPTGGYTLFDFEANTALINNQETTVGGLRIKTITNYDPVADKSVVTTYSYLDQTTQKTSGTLFSKPTYIQIFRNDWYAETNYLGNHGNGCWDLYGNDQLVARSFLFSDNPLRPMETTQGNHVGYKNVRVSQQNNGYVDYEFYVPNIVNNEVAITHIDNPSTCSTTGIPNYPPAPINMDFSRGELHYETYHSQDGSFIKQMKYEPEFSQEAVTTPGRAYYQFSSFTAETYYELKTSYKTATTTTETDYQPDQSSLQTQVHTFYESHFHHQPTTITSMNSQALELKKKIKYAFDYRVPLFDNTTNCNNINSSIGFKTYSGNLLHGEGNYATQFYNCAGYTASCYNPILASYGTSLWGARKAYVECRRTNYTDATNTFQTNHNTAKASADPELKPILWMQDVYQNAPIEITQWKSNNLLTATYNKYNNLRDDAFGIYPEKTLKVDLSAPATDFSASGVSSNGTSVTRDQSYSDFSLFDFNLGNLISITGRDGVAESYEWGYNTNFPTVKILNATNNLKETLQQQTISTNSQLDFTNGATTSHIQTSFNQTQTGTIKFTLETPPNNYQVLIYHGSLTNSTNSINLQIDLCSSGLNGPNCSYSNTVNFNNMPPGTYTIDCSATTTHTGSTTTPFLSHLNYDYQGAQINTSGTKEFFYDGFEDNQAAKVISGYGHSGKKFWNGDYVTSFTKPTSGKYIVQWWNLVSGQWNFNEQTYTSGMTLIGPVDDVRIFPDDAQMSTYSYDPLKGMTSASDPNGKTMYYEYDNLGRLKVVRDKDGNIIKKYCYNYAGQSVDCGGYTNETITKWFVKKNCSAGNGGVAIPYSVLAGTYTSQTSVDDANLQAWADINTNGQNFANSQPSEGNCLLLSTITGINYSTVAGYTISYINTYDNSVLLSYTYPSNDAKTGQTINLGYLPQGTYKVSIFKTGYNSSQQFTVNCSPQLSILGARADFDNVAVTDTGCNWVQIGIQQSGQ